MSIFCGWQDAQIAVAQPVEVCGGRENSIETIDVGIEHRLKIILHGCDERHDCRGVRHGGAPFPIGTGSQLRTHLLGMSLRSVLFMLGAGAIFRQKRAKRISVVSKAALDAIDRRIIAELQRDGRISNVELADRVGLSPSPCLRRVKLLNVRAT